MTNSNGNYYVSVLTEFEKEIQKMPSSNKIITPASLKSENQFLKEVDSLALSNAQLNVKRFIYEFLSKESKVSKIQI